MVATTAELPRINADLGEGYGAFAYGDDDGVAPYIDVGNIACGYHGGDPVTIARMVRMCGEHDLQIAAHPSLPDREGFGRRPMTLSTEELRASLIYQIGALSGFVRAEGLALSYVKPHGRLYMVPAQDEAMAEVFCDVAEMFELGIYGITGTWTDTVARRRGLPFYGEFFADLEYRDEGGMIVTKAKAPSPEWVEKRIVRAVNEGMIDTLSGALRPLQFETICIHNDMPNAADLAKAARRAMETLAAQRTKR